MAKFRQNLFQANRGEVCELRSCQLRSAPTVLDFITSSGMRQSVSGVEAMLSFKNCILLDFIDMTVNLL